MNSHLPVPLQVLADVDCLLDEGVQVLRKVRSQTLGFQDAENLVASHKAHLGHTVRITEDDTCAQICQRLGSLAKLFQVWLQKHSRFGA